MLPWRCLLPFSDLKENGEGANNEDSYERILVDDDDDDGQAEDGDKELNGSLEDHKKQPKNLGKIRAKKIWLF